MTRTEKIGAACFIGALAGIAYWVFALQFAPMFQWFSIVVSFGLGFLAYEFDVTVRALPRAFALLLRPCGRLVAVASRFAKKPHPVAILGFFPAVVLMGWSFGDELQPARLLEYTPVGNVAAACFFFAVIYGALAEILFALMILGAFYEKVYWHGILCEEDMDPHKRHEIIFTNRDGWRLMAAGYAAIIAFLLWYLWKYIGIGVYRLVRAIYCNERLLCGVGATVGLLAAVVVLRSTGAHDASLSEYAMLSFFGGMIGAVFGIASWHIVSRGMFGYGVSD